ncbi:MAG: ABC transporter substrate-binding protein [Candidatus Eisenbacteria sp.]|nr:ABC transporter substrate-binding protein [Candidatus Eisenbacteria bacterium]
MAARALATRIVSLVPSLTEAICDLGGLPRLVGVTDFCTSPGEIDRLARVGGPRNVALAELRALRPDLVIACREENSKSDVEQILSFAPVEVLSCRSLGDAGPLLERLGRLLGAEARATAISSGIARAEVEVGASIRWRPRTFYPVWREPWMAVGRDCFPAAMLAAAGASSLFADRAEPYPLVSLEEVTARAPELVLLPDEPWAFRESDRCELQRRLGLDESRVALLPGRWAGWYGTRIESQLKRLVALVQGLDEGSGAGEAARGG